MSIFITGSKSAMSLEIDRTVLTKNSLAYILQSTIGMLGSLKNDTSSCN